VYAPTQNSLPFSSILSNYSKKQPHLKAIFMLLFKDKIPSESNSFLKLGAKQ